jgi:hypothetical protein
LDDARPRSRRDVNGIAPIACIAARQVSVTPCVYGSLPPEKEQPACAIWCRASDVAALQDFPSAPRLSTEALDCLAARHRVNEGGQWEW